MPKLYLVCGFLGAGKTTISKKLAMEFRAEHINVDEWCMRLHTPEEYETDWENCFAKTINIIWENISQKAANQKSIILDMGFWDKKSRDLARQKAVEFGMNTQLYYIYAPDEILKQRISLRKGKIAEHNLNNFDNIKKLFQEPSYDEPHIKINNY